MLPEATISFPVKIYLLVAHITLTLRCRARNMCPGLRRVARCNVHSIICFDTLRARTGRAMFAQHELALGDHADHNRRATMAKELMQCSCGEPRGAWDDFAVTYRRHLA